MNPSFVTYGHEYTFQFITLVSSFIFEKKGQNLLHSIIRSGAKIASVSPVVLHNDFLDSELPLIWPEYHIMSIILYIEYYILCMHMKFGISI